MNQHRTKSPAHADSVQPIEGEPEASASQARAHAPPVEANVKRHLSFGCWALFGFATLGLLLEALHGYKVDFYLDVSNETRRLMWRLGHAHGVLLSLLNLVFALLLSAGRVEPLRVPTISVLLLFSSLLLPAGFILGGVVIHAGDPGPGVLLVPFGAVVLLAALFLLAKSVR